MIFFSVSACVSYSFPHPICHLFQTLAKVALPCFYWHAVIHLQLFSTAVKIQEHLPSFSQLPQTLRINKASENEWEDRESESLTNDVSTWAKFPIIDTIGNYSTYSSPLKWARMFELDRLPLTWLVRSAWGQRSPRRPHGNQGNLAFDTRSVFRGNGSNLWRGKKGLCRLLRGLIAEL